MLGLNAISQAPIASLGSGDIIINVSGQQSTISLGIVNTISSYLITGQQINASVNSVIVESESFISIPG